MAFEIVLPPRTIGLSCALGAIVIGASLAYIYLPQAAITITPATQDRSVSQSIILSSGAKEPDFIKFILPAKLVETEVKEERTVTREGAKESEALAAGTVRLINRQDEDQDLLPKTHLRHEATGVFFLTDTPVRIPAKGEVSMNVTAKEVGASGNVPPGKFIVDKLPESLQSEVYAESSQAFSGGVIVEDPLTQEEIDAIKQEITVKAKEKALGDLTLKAGGASIPPDLITLDTVAEDVSAEVGSLTRTFTVSLTQRARGFVVDRNDLLSLTLLRLREDVADDEEFIEYDPESFSLQIDGVDFDRGEIRVTGTLTGIISSKIGSNELKTSNIAGLSPEEAKEHFEQFESVGEANIELSPFWVRAIPSREEAIRVEIRS